jgi:redox-sensitive bicupin YhaK (pirin superfamily)
MAKDIQIRKIIKSMPATERADDHLLCAFENNKSPIFDPFLLLDVFCSGESRYFLKGFACHPHQDIETISYVLAGNDERSGSMSHIGDDGAGDFQWAAAGGDSLHQELSLGETKGHIHVLQLWANLPATSTMRDPRYRRIPDEEIPSVAASGGATINVIAGKVNGVVGPVQDSETDPEYLDIFIPPHNEFTYSTMSGHIVFAYIIEGSGLFCKGKTPFSFEGDDVVYFNNQGDLLIENDTLMLFGDGEQVFVATKKDPMHFLLVSGKSIGEPAAWYGPIVMNTREELQTAFE